MFNQSLFDQARRTGWIRCLVWGMIKAVGEGISFFLRLADLWMKISFGLIWVGIASAALLLFWATQHSAKSLGFPSALRTYLVLQIVGLVLLVAQLPLLALGLFFVDGIVTIVATTLSAFAGYGVAQELRNLGWFSTPS